MKQNLGLRFFIIAFVLLFLGYKAFIGVTSDDPDERLQLGIDLRGGSELRYRLDLSAQETAAKKRAVRDQSLEIIQDRIDGYGLKDIVLQAIGEESFTVQLSARTRESVDAIKELIEVLGNLEFRITVEQPDDAPYWKIFSEALKQGGAGVKAARVITPEERTAEDKLSNRHGFGLKWYRLSDRSIKKGSLPGRTRDGWVLCRLDEDNISGSDLINTTHRLPAQSFGEGWVVSFDVRKLARPSMARLTSTPKEYMAIILNDRVDSAPILQSTLNANGQISGGFTEKEARQLAAVLQSGALQQRPELVEETTIAPDLAGNARDRGINSTLIAFLMVLVLMLAYYRTPGLVANLALLLNLLILLGVLTWFDAVLTLPGIAGVILTVGMAVDANILVFERIKEEKAKGRTPAQALETGYDRALVTIIDSNLTTLITAYFLFQIGSGPVRGFGITLAIGILASMFTALLVTRTLMTWFMQKGWMKEVRMPGRFAPPAIPWMAMRRGTGRVSAFAIVAGLTLFALVPENKNLDLEFTKGSKLVISLRESMDLDDFQKRLDTLAAKDALYGGIETRVVAAGIGTRISESEGLRFELRSQRIASEEQINALVSELRNNVLKGKILPGPFSATIRAAEAGSGDQTQGELHFAESAIGPEWVAEALRQYAAKNKVLTKARVEAIPTAAGALSSLRLTLPNDPPDQPATVALNVRNALEAFDGQAAINYWTEQKTSGRAKPIEQQEAAQKVEYFEAVAQRPAPSIRETDPFPLADRVDPSTAEQHRNAAVQAIALSLLGIILYVAFRFRSWAFGFGAVVALVHDVSIVLGITALVNWLGIVDARLNLVTVAAYLTVIGYSINDTIVIFDRIRENRGSGRARMSEVIDRSINQNLSRTIRTSVTTAAVVLVLFVLNVGAQSSLEGFAFILFLGVLVGTYSSIFIASPAILFLPWMWRQCGGTGAAFAKRLMMVAAAVTIILIGWGVAQNRIPPTGSSDPSVAITNAILLSLPLALLGMLLYYMLRWLKLDDPDKALLQT